MSATTTRLLSAEEFALLPENHSRLTLVRGRVVESLLPGMRHGAVTAALGFRLGRWADDGRAGVVGLRAGVILARDPDTVRAPDLWYLRADRVPSGGVPDAFWETTLDLAVEVARPSERANEIREKVQDYLSGGTALVVMIYPETRELVAHTPDGMARTYQSVETFTAPGVLPGFSCPVAKLFA